MALDVTSCSDEREKLQWAFRLYDVDASGSVNLREVLAIMATLDEVEGLGARNTNGMFARRGSLDDRAGEIFAALDVDNDGVVTMTEFVEGYLR
jgi:Ca2+-binding EF-hand superfamily protein